MKLILSSILLGFGGFDPMGAILIMAELAKGTKKKQIYLFFTHNKNKSEQLIK
ncbi:MAG: hypothetical protein E7H12_07165 [Staphylococcus aureus]|nr:hypothetical protein [Staphylococcus aureus]